jgi:16S rRNA (guanine1516-N2)-methyltransferase
VDDTYGRQPLQIDFVSDPRFSQPMTLREPLAKAVGLRANRRPLVFDLTAGLGRDAWALASTGCRVVAFERHPLMAFLLADGLRRAALQASTSATASRISLLACDPRAIDSGIEGFIDPASVWLMDPMFPERRKTALVKKAMRIFQALVGSDDDAVELFSWSRQQSGARWVVKRPPQAPRIDGSAPSMEITSGRIRFDCYL